MCTAIAIKGNDLLYCYNLDVDPDVWNFGLYRTKTLFSVGITVGSTTYYTHGVNARGRFGNLPYMNGEAFEVPRGSRRERIDLITDRYLRGKYSFEDVERIVAEKTVVNAPAATMHSLIGNERGDFFILEPGYGCRRAEGDYTVLTNFPVFAKLDDYSNPFYGRDRYDRVEAALKNRSRTFSAEDALALLCDVKQTGQWGTRISFVYSRNANGVFYCTDGDFSQIAFHGFREGAEGNRS